MNMRKERSLLSTHADRQGVDKLVTACLFVILCVCVCTVEDFSAEDKCSGVKFRTMVHWRPGQGISHFGKLCRNQTNRPIREGR